MCALASGYKVNDYMVQYAIISGYIVLKYELLKLP